MRNYRKYTHEEFIEAVKASKSIAGALRELGLKPCGGNYYTAKKLLQALDLNTDHFTGQAWNKGEKLKDWQDYKKPNSFKKHLIEERGAACDCCKQDTWMEQPIPLEVHHIDGDRTNNSLGNLQVLCCNCHALTDNWKGRGGKLSEEEKSERVLKPRNRPKDKCPKCEKEKSIESKLCKDCYEQPSKIVWPSVEEMTKLVFEMPMMTLAKKLGVSDVTIGKFCKENNIPKPYPGYWMKLKWNKLEKD